MKTEAEREGHRRRPRDPCRNELEAGRGRKEPPTTASGEGSSPAPTWISDFLSPGVR